MISTEDLLFIEPQRPASPTAVIDVLTRRMTGAYRLAERSPYGFCGLHQCVCGVYSTAYDYLLPNGEKTNSLCVHYLAHHRKEVPKQQLERVAALSYGESDPSEEELRGRRWRENEPGDFIGRARLAAFRDLGLDLSPAFWAAEALKPSESLAYFMVLGNLRKIPSSAIPALVDAIQHKYGEITRWTRQAFWGRGWQEAWAYPALAMIRDTNPEVRLWALAFLWPGIAGETIPTLGISGSHARVAVSTLVGLALQDDNEQVRSEALLALDRHQQSELKDIALPLLAGALRHPDRRGRYQAELALRKIDAPKKWWQLWKPVYRFLLARCFRGRPKAGHL